MARRDRAWKCLDKVDCKTVSFFAAHSPLALRAKGVESVDPRKPHTPVRRPDLLFKDREHSFHQRKEYDCFAVCALGCQNTGEVFCRVTHEEMAFSQVVSSD